MLSLYKLEIFNAVAVEGSFSKAAARLFMTQPAVSQHMRDMETSLGTELFERTSKGVTLTTAGETLLDYTRCILRLVNEAEAAVMEVNELESGHLAIGATPGAGVYLLPQWIRTFHQRFPNLATAVRTDTTSSLAADVTSGRLDLAFVEGELNPEPPLSVLPLREIHLFVLVGSGHPWWDQAEIPLTSLAGQPFITRPSGSQTRAWIEQVFQKHRVRPRIIAEFDNPEAIKEAVASGMGVTILPEWVLQRERSEDRPERLRAIPIQGLDLRRTLKLLWNGDQPFKPVSRAFLAHLTEEFPRLAQIVSAEAAGDGSPGSALNLKLPRRESYKASLRSCVAGRIHIPDGLTLDS